jgi:DNA-directed RNA polymerase specialized sigma24 family protein
MGAGGSVTTWIGLLQAGEEEAAQCLWERYFPRLLELARARLQGIPRRVADEEDVALSAFHTFSQAVNRKQVPQLSNRDDLWRTLVLITAGKAVDERRRQSSQKRGGGRSFDPPDGPADLQALEEVIGTEPDPAFAAQIGEEFQMLLARLADDRLREIALLKLEGYTNDEIAARLKCSPRSVTRRLTVIRRVWSEG